MYAESKASLLDNYQNQTVMTASPGDLIVMLYDALIKQIKLSQLFLQNKEYERVNRHLCKAQAIVTALVQSLDLKYDIAADLLQIYDYILNELIMANTSKNGDLLPEILEILRDLREAWYAAKQATTSKSYIIED
ncbi:MAG: flagellar export chaperone FliS [Eubacteriales bacterium]|nr:flagellar export chaperone FliS [Eubacteriales bacterium]